MNISQVLTKLKALIYSKSETDSLLGGKANSSHTHTKSQITDFPSLATVATSGSYNDLSNKPSSMAPSSHSHGNITNAGAIGTTANKPLITTTNGAITIGSFGTTANTFCQGNDSRLSDARTPTSHTHTKSQITDFPSLATVATSGSYSDLSNKPTIPSNTNQLTNGAGYITSSGSCSHSSTSAKLIGDDTRNNNYTPANYINSGQRATIRSEFKQRSTLGAPGDSTYGTSVTITPWSDNSGGRSVQLYFSDTGYTSAIRFATSDSAWSSWYQLNTEYLTKLNGYRIYVG